MKYKETKKHLLKEGVIKECPIDFRAIENLIQRASTDLKTAKEFASVIRKKIKKNNPQKEMDL